MSRIMYTRKSFLSQPSEVDEDLSLINFYYSSKIYNFNYKQQQRLGWKDNGRAINTTEERASGKIIKVVQGRRVMLCARVFVW